MEEAETTPRVPEGSSECAWADVPRMKRKVFTTPKAKRKSSRPFSTVRQADAAQRGVLSHFLAFPSADARLAAQLAAQLAGLFPLRPRVRFFVYFQGGAVALARWAHVCSFGAQAPARVAAAWTTRVSSPASSAALSVLFLVRARGPAFNDFSPVGRGTASGLTSHAQKTVPLFPDCTDGLLRWPTPASWAIGLYRL